MLTPVQCISNHLVYPVLPADLGQHQAVFPELKHKYVQNAMYAAVPHTVDYAQVLRNLGYEAPSPIRFGYEWPGMYKPYKHQVVTAEFFTLNRRCYCLNGMGSGKTMSALWASDYLKKKGKVNKILIVSPLSTLERVWGDEIFRNFPFRKFAVLHGSRQRRLDLLASNAEIYIINHHGVEVVAEELAKRTDINLIIIDEVAVLRNQKTKMWRTMNSLITPERMVWGMTGTPTPNSPTDAFAQMKLITPSNFTGHFTKFKMLTMQQLGQFKWIPRRGAEELVNQVMRPSIRYALRDCIDLPETIYHSRDAELSGAQQHIYLQLRRDAIAQVGGTEVTAVNAAVLVSKLVQAACIAEGTPVITSRGLVPIEQVRLTDEVWDGVEWCSHDGVIDKGIQHVIDCGQVRMTEDHLILTSRGWKPAEEAKYGHASGGLNWAEVQLPFGTRASWVNYGANEVREVAMPVRLRGASSSGEPEPAEGQQTQRQPLRVSGCGALQDTRNEQDPTLRNLDAYEPEVLQSRVSGLQKLRGSGHNSMQRVAEFLRGVLGGHAARLFTNAYARTFGQRWALQQTQLPMGDTPATVQQQTIERIYRNTEGLDDCSASIKSMGVKEYNASRQTVSIQVGYDTSTDYTRVYDIVNCGPRNRFVVQASNGEARIVHNCGVMYGAGTDIAEVDFGPRLNVLEEIVEESDGKIIIFVPFTAVLNALRRELSKHWTTEVIDGSVSSSRRNQILKDFQESGNPRILLANPGTMAHGLTLTAASTIIWYAPIYSNEMYEQANARIVRPGQKKVTNIVHIAATAVERRIYGVLREKGRLQSVVLDLAKGEMR